MSSNSDLSSPANREKLLEDVKVLTKDVQELLKATASVVSEKAADARSRVQESLKIAQSKLGTAHEAAKAKGAEAAAVTDEYVRDNPWNAVGIAAGLGLLIGLVIAASTFGSRSDD